MSAFCKFIVKIGENNQIKMRNHLVLLLVTITLIVQNAIGVQIDGTIQNRNIERTIDLTTQLVKISYKITLENQAKNEFSGVSYSFFIPKEDREHLSYISIRDALKKELKATEEKAADGSFYTVSVTSSSPTPVLHIETVFSQALEPYPTQITQNERQLVRYFGNAYVNSPYKTLSQKTTIPLASKSVESYTAVKPSTQTDGVVTYGPYENVERKFFLFGLDFYLKCLDGVISPKMINHLKNCKLIWFKTDVK